MPWGQPCNSWQVVTKTQVVENKKAAESLAWWVALKGHTDSHLSKRSWINRHQNKRKKGHTKFTLSHTFPASYSLHVVQNSYEISFSFFILPNPCTRLWHHTVTWVKHVNRLKQCWALRALCELIRKGLVSTWLSQLFITFLHSSSAI